MNNKLFVGNLSWDIDDAELREAFEPFGEIVEAVVIKDRVNNRSRGYGFVTFKDAESAKKALEALDGEEVDGRPINVSEARDKNE